MQLYHLKSYLDSLPQKAEMRECIPSNKESNEALIQILTQLRVKEVLGENGTSTVKD